MLNSRYDDQIAIFGQEIQEKLSKSNIFMVGAGALGCEYLKLFSLMGISTDKNSRTTITDNDNIEISNLSRQFLFSIDDIGKCKSECACIGIRKMNKEFNYEPHKNLVCTETENIYNENFFERQTFLISAVDNNKARKYLDTQAIIFKKPLLDAGTEGTKANSILVIPDLTDSLSEIRKDNNGNKYTSCTLKSFPSLIEHCIEWGKVLFEKFFISDIKEIIDLIEEKENKLKKINNLTPNEKLSYLNDIKENLILLNSKKYEDCIEMAFRKFYFYFIYRIEKLLKDNPINLKSQDGTFFWSGSKRMPSIITFDVKDKLCKEFIFSFSNLIARCLGIDAKNDISDEVLIKINEKVKSSYKINRIFENDDMEEDDDLNTQDNKGNEEENISEDIDKKEEEKLNTLLKDIKNLLKNIDKSKKITPEIFDKDDDSNGQINFIYCFSNLRARNYKLNECDKLKVKFIAGRIIPAVESTTAAVTGFNCTQIYSLLINEKLENFSEVQMDLGTSFFSYHSPFPKKLKKSYEKNKKKYIAIRNEWSIWDKTYLNGPMTIKSFLEYFENKYQINIRGIYTEKMEPIMNKKFLDENIEEIYCKLKNVDINSIRHLIQLFLDANDGKKNIIHLPPVIYKF